MKQQIQQNALNNQTGPHNSISSTYDQSLKSTLLSCQTYTQIQAFNFKSSLFSASLSKKDFEFYSQFYLTKINHKYKQVLAQLQKTVREIECHLELARANQIRTLNNVIRVYLRRTEMNEQSAIKQFKYDTFEKEQEWLLEQLIENPFCFPTQTYTQKLTQITQKLTATTSQAQSALNSLPSLPELTTDPKQIINILNQCDVHLHNHVHKFSATFTSVEKILQQSVDDLNLYWNSIEDIGTRLALQTKSEKEKELALIIAKSSQKSIDIDQSSFSHAIYDQSPIYNLLAEGHYSSISKSIIPYQSSKPKSKQLQSVKKIGQMSNKRKGKQSILQSSDKKTMLLITNRYLDVDKEERELNGEEIVKRSDFWTCFYAKANEEGRESLRREIRPDNKRHSVEQINCTTQTTGERQSLEQLINRTYPMPGDVQSLYYYQQLNMSQNFMIQHPISNLVQSRLVFEAGYFSKVNEEFQSINRQKTMLQEKVDALRQKEKKEADGFNIGFRKANKMEERNSLERFMKEGFDEEFLPQVVDWDQVDAGEESEEEKVGFDYRRRQKKFDKGIVFEKLGQFSSGTGNRSEIKQKKEGQNPHKLIQNAGKQKVLNLSKSTNKLPPQQQQQPATSTKHPSPSPNEPTQKPPLPSPLSLEYQPTLLSSLTECYFMNIETKYTRLAKDQKIHKTFYCPSIEASVWEAICVYLHHVERVFVVLELPVMCLVRMEKLYSVNRQMVKCVVYQFGSQLKDIEKDFLKKKVTSSLNHTFVVTFSFKPIKPAEAQIPSTPIPLVQPKNIQKSSILNHLPCTGLKQVSCLTGMLTVLIYEQKLQETEYEIGDFIIKGEELVKEYELFFLEDKENQVQSYSDIVRFDHSYYQKLAKINYVFNTENDQGLDFDMLSTAAINKQEQERVEVFRTRTKKYKIKGKYDLDQEDQAMDKDGQEDNDESDESQDDEDEKERPVFIPMKSSKLNEDQREAREKETLQSPEKNKVGSSVQKKQQNLESDKGLMKQTSQKNQHKPLALQQQKKAVFLQQQVPKLVLDESSPFSVQTKDGIKRSNSREELKNMTAENFIFDLTYRQVEAEQVDERFDQILENVNNAQNQQENHSQAGQDDEDVYDDDDNDDVIGL